MTNLRGPIVALLTPFEANGAIDWLAFEAYLSALDTFGVQTVISNGTTGEFPSLTINERRLIVEFVREHFQGTVIDNVSATCIGDVRELIAGTQDCADALLLLPPYYYSACRADGLCRFFIDALSGTSTPVLLYNFPQHTGNPIGIDLVAMLLKHNLTVLGIKDSSGDIANALNYGAHFPDLKIFLGNDSQVFDVLQRGLSGSVTGASNPLPELLTGIQQNILFPQKAQAMQTCLDVWNAFRDASGYLEIPLVKAAMGARVSDFPIHVRPPFTAIPSGELDRIREVILDCLSAFKRLDVP